MAHSVNIVSRIRPIGFIYCSCIFMLQRCYSVISGMVIPSPGDMKYLLGFDGNYRRMYLSQSWTWLLNISCDFFHA